MIINEHAQYKSVFVPTFGESQEYKGLEWFFIHAIYFYLGAQSLKLHGPCLLTQHYISVTACVRFEASLIKLIAF